MSARRAIESQRARGTRAFVPFLTAGFPDWDACDAAVRLLHASGADVLELGVPFSDPIADGPTIQASSQAALASGVTLAGILERVAASRAVWDLPVILMSYSNPILAYGVERFARDAAAAGVAGTLISDLPPDELPEMWAALAAHGLETALLVAPTSRADRVEAIARAATGFVYCVTRTGVTGAGGAYSDRIGEQVARVRAVSPVPVLAGFGIRSARDVAALAVDCDGVVVGARLIELLREAGLDALGSLARELRAALDAPAGNA